MSQLFASGGQSIGVAASKSVIPMNMYGCESWTIKKGEHRRIDAFELWCWRRLLRVPWTARRSNQSILKINPGCSLVGLYCLAATLIQAGRSRRFDGLVEIIAGEITWQTKPKPKDKPYNTVVRISEGGHIVAVQSLSHVRLFATPWIAVRQASLSLTNSWSLLKLMSIKLVMPSNHHILCHPLFVLPSIFPTIRVFSNESVLCIRWPKCWNFSFNISPYNEYSGLIYFKMDWLDLHAVQGTLKSLLQNHSSKASVLQHSTFFIVQLSHPYMTTGKTKALTLLTLVGKVMSLKQL